MSFMALPDARKSGIEDNHDPFPVTALPPLMRQMARETSQLAQVSVGLPACAVLATISASLGRGLVITSDIDDTYGNLYVIAGALSGSGKSVTFKAVMEPVSEYQNAVRTEASNARPRIKAKLAGLEATLKDARARRSVLSEDEHTALIARVDALQCQLDQPEPAIVCEDVTPQALHDRLARNHEVMFSASGDARHCIHVVSKDRDDNPYLKAWSGDPTEVARITRKSVSLNAPRMALLWLPQTDVMLEMFTRPVLTANGFLPRVLPYVMDYSPVERDSEARRISAETKLDWQKLVRGLFETYHANHDAPLVAKKSKQVRDELMEYKNSVVRRVQNEPGPVQPYAARWAEQAWRLTLVLHAGRYGAKAHKEMVTSRTAEDAVTLMDFFSRQQLALLSSSLDRAKTEQEVAVLNKLAVKPEMTARDFIHDHVLTSTTEAKALLEQMVATGKLDFRDQRPERGGVPARYYRRK